MIFDYIQFFDSEKSEFIRDKYRYTYLNDLLQEFNTYFNCNITKYQMYFYIKSYLRLKKSFPAKKYFKNHLKTIKRDITPDMTLVDILNFFESKYNIYIMNENAIKDNLDRFNIPYTRSKRRIDIPEEIINKAIEFNNKGMNITQIAKILGYNRPVIAYRLTERNIPINTNRNNLSKKTEARIVELYTKDRLPSTFIAKMFNVSSGKVISILRKNGVDIRINKMTKKLKERISQYV